MSCTPRLPAVEELDPAQTLGVPDAAVADDSACGVYATYQRLRDENPGLLAPTPVRYADGTLAYLRGLLPRPGALANRVAVMANNCRITTLDDAEAEYLANHRAVWGDIAVESAWDIVHEPLTGPLDFFVWMPARPFDPEPLLEQVRAVVGNARLMTQPSILFFTATVEQAVAISDFEGVNVIILDWAPPVGKGAVAFDPARVPSVADWYPSGVLTTRSDQAFASNGIFATGVRVGIQEALRGCTLDSTHEAFSLLTGLHHEVGASACSVGCATECGVVSGNPNPILSGADCVNNECVDRHLTGVASRIASTQGAGATGQPSGPFHAAKTELYLSSFANNSDLASLAENIDNYKYFALEGVFIVNESIGADGVTTSQGFKPWSVASDWAARNYGITIVRSAGNRTGSASTTGNFETSCAGYNSLCVGSSRWNMNPRDPAFAAWSTSSRFANPYWNTGAERKELEKPDLLAEGEYTHAAISKGVDRWYSSPGEVDQFGTSFAAPVVTGIVALLQEQCGRGGPLPPAYYRSLLRTLGTWDRSRAETAAPFQGFSPNTCGGSVVAPPLYPAPHLGCDHYGGAGVISTRLLDARACPGTQVECEGTLEDPCVANGSGTLREMGNQPSWLETDPKEWLENSTSSQSLRQSGAGFAALYDYPAGARGIDTRIRTTFSYYSCPVPTQPASTLAPSNNLDVVLWGRRTGSATDEIVFAAEALHETNEGFDVTLRADYDTLFLAVLGPSTLAGCIDADNNPTSGEPFWWWTMWGKP